MDYLKFTERTNELRANGFNASADRILNFLDPDFDDINLNDKGYMDTLYHSLEGYIRLVKKVHFKKEATLGLFNEGTIGAQWQWENHNAMLIEFLDNDKVTLARIGDIKVLKENITQDELISWMLEQNDG